MTHTCKCGGRLRRTDIRGAYDSKLKRVMYTDLDPKTAHWACDKCGAVVKQRKRQPNVGKNNPRPH